MSDRAKVELSKCRGQQAVVVALMPGKFSAARFALCLSAAPWSPLDDQAKTDPVKVDSWTITALCHCPRASKLLLPLLIDDTCCFRGGICATWLTSSLPLPPSRLVLSDLIVFVMATEGDASAQAFAPVLAALATMQGNAPRDQKTQAHEFLESFQKSVRLLFCPSDETCPSKL